MASPEFAQLLTQLRRQPPAGDASVEEIRAGVELLTGMAPLPPNAHWQATRAGYVPAEWVTDLRAVDDRALLYLHGGSFVSGSAAAYRDLTARLSAAIGCRVLVPEYRLAPEHPFPAALEDVFSSYRWLLDRGFAPSRIAVGGDAAGGGLAIATLLSLRDADLPRPAAAFVLSPWVDLTGTSRSLRTRLASDPVLHPDLLRRCADAYLAGSDPRAPLVSPLFADLAGLPDLLVQTGTSEILFDDACRLAERAADSGVGVVFEAWEEMIHVWHLFAAALPEAQKAIDRVAAFVRARTDPGSRTG